MGLPILECPDAASAIATGDEVEADLDRGIIINHTRDETYQAQQVPPFMQQLVQAGGLIPYVQEQMRRQGQ
jgi:3-isopropylmalate/(R)-2-methylmalate dehydratase small subunit